MRPKILLCDDDALQARSLRELLRVHGFDCDMVTTASDALLALRDQPRDVLITDVNLGAAVDGFWLLQEAHAIIPDLPVLMITGYGSIAKAVAAIKAGAEDYIAKPIDDEALLLVIRRCLERHRLRKENQDLKRALTDKWRHALIATDPHMLQVMKVVEAAADTRATVLIMGESGTGKTMLAREIHQRSARRAMTFVEVNCGALPESLLESELFGHVKGAFTGALRDKVGKFEHASGGTIFLDEISTASPALQVKLLRVLQDRVIERVGGLSSIEVDVRVILATNTDLEAAVKNHTFREDLYYRINVVNVRLPSLRERPEDVLPLAQHFVHKYAVENTRAVPTLSPAALRRIQDYSWPGNVRELENAMQRAVIMGAGTSIEEADLPTPLRVAKPALHAPSASPAPLRQALEEPERRLIEEALRAHGWSRHKTAHALGVNRTTLFHKMKKYGLLKPGVRGDRSGLGGGTR